MASSGNFKQDVYAQLARVAKALGHANRLELLEFAKAEPQNFFHDRLLADIQKGLQV